MFNTVSFMALTLLIETHMKTKLTILTAFCGVAWLALAQDGKQSSGNAGGQALPPPVTTSKDASLPPGFPPVNAENKHSYNPVVDDSMTSGRTNNYQVTNGPAWRYGNTNGGYNGDTNSDFRFNRNSNFNSENYQSGNTNGTGSMTNWVQYTNANGTVTFNTNIPHWWEKR